MCASVQLGNLDFYTDITPKGMEHERRYQKSAPDMVVMEDNPATVKHELFLANRANKSRSIELLCRKLNNPMNSGKSQTDYCRVGRHWPVSYLRRPS